MNYLVHFLYGSRIQNYLKYKLKLRNKKSYANTSHFHCISTLLTYLFASLPYSLFTLSVALLKIHAGILTVRIFSSNFWHSLWHAYDNFLRASTNHLFEKYFHLEARCLLILPFNFSMPATPTSGPSTFVVLDDIEGGYKGIEINVVHLKQGLYSCMVVGKLFFNLISLTR